MTSHEKDCPACFGDLETVFPMGADGLRHSPENCMERCACNTECLRTAIQGNAGLKVRDEKVDREYSAGAMGFFERWSRKKTLYRKMKKAGSEK